MLKNILTKSPEDKKGRKNILRIIKVTLISFGFGLLTESQTSQAATIIDNNPNFVLVGQLRETFDTLSGITSGVEVDLGNGLQNTGEISFFLDPNGNSFFDYDFDVGTASAHLELLATFPLQQDLGVEPVTIVIDETGNITEVLETLGTSQDTSSWEATFDGSITQPSGVPQLTTGTLNATSFQVNPDPLITLDILSTDILSTLSGIGTVLTEPFVDLFVRISHNWYIDRDDKSDPRAVPEPNSIFGIGTVLVFGIFFKRKYSKREKEKS